jgi:hypothetical protein
MKSTILLTTAIFLASAPAPDSRTISEISAGFLSPKNDHGLMAAESRPNLKADPGITTQLATQPTTEE